MAALPGVARLAGSEPAAERIPSGPLRAYCDATASGAEDAQVLLAKGRREIALCGHHYRNLEFTLAVEGWRITHDSRRRPV